MLNRDDAYAVLAGFNCVDVAPVLSSRQRRILREALCAIAPESDYQIFGVCAEDLSTALAGLAGYTQALGCGSTGDPEARGTAADGPVYVKFNSRSGLFYSEPYDGTHRGVLVSCQSDHAEGFNALFGHLPLDLFDVDRDAASDAAASAES